MSGRPSHSGRTPAQGRGAQKQTSGSRRSNSAPASGKGRGNRVGSSSNRSDRGQGTSKRRSDDLGADHVEGRQAVRELLRAGKRRVQEVLVGEEVNDSAIIAEINDLATDRRIPVKQVSRRRLDERALSEAHQGVIAFAEPIKPLGIEELLKPRGSEVPFLIVLDGVTDPGNLGAVLRTAEVAGASGIVLPRHRAVRLTPSAVKAAAGAVEYLRIALVGGLPAALAQMKESGIWTVGLDGDGTDSVQNLELATKPLALVLGAEGQGLSHLVRERCDQIVSIPQKGRVQSLNVAAAAAIAMYEVRRRRDLDA